ADAAGAVVSAGAQQDRVLQPHRRVAVRQRTAEGRGQTAAVRVAVFQGEVGGAVVLLPCGDEREVHAGVVRVLVGAGVGVVHPVLQVRLHPRSTTDAVPEPAGGAPLDGVHGGVAVIAVVRLAAAVVVAA